jgi:hypothetical protein
MRGKGKATQIKEQRRKCAAWFGDGVAGRSEGDANQCEGKALGCEGNAE